MTSEYFHLAQARTAIMTLLDTPHKELCLAQARFLEETSAASKETGKSARFHPIRVFKEVAVGGLSALSALYILVFGRSIAELYSRMQQQISKIEIPFVNIEEQLAGAFPPIPILDQLYRLPELTPQDAVYGAIGVAVLILVVRLVQAAMTFRRERLLAHSVKEIGKTIRVLKEASKTESRDEALGVLTVAMQEAFK